ncbi:bifunctional UDP-N-acetylglucosamine diphosphorylase/glucosamine-1-phosphate N-acetyltransferase GlmU [Hyphomicrobium sp.]|jgi:bifunctional UDP-N-acetylglucosamine pyrophosphorylase/glucosamine-1-phosphate N-acetyltransferase|uniref:bifunctional UDP-N-acetylglucosamine diphosphorylase/glucosamine-1-phosphate N-acetyltransferase GlmU n=1 Tax=Hyphomicrobium sp. TaxID=82 RepID=UPI0035630CC2
MSAGLCLYVVLAAGKGTRMKSSLPKVLHSIAGQSMLAHVLGTASLGGGKMAVVVAPDSEAVAAEALRIVPDAKIFEQATQRGTADALLAAKPALQEHTGDVIVLFADTPLVRPDVLAELRAALDDGAGIAVLGFRSKNPTGYGRLLIDDGGALMAIREERDASDAEKKVGLCNSGVMAFRVPDLSGLLSRIGCANAKNEYYLTDVVAIGRELGIRAAVVVCDEDDVLGINTREQLAQAEAVWQARTRVDMMREGVTMIAPETVWLSFDTKIGRDVILEPNVIFGPGVTVEAGARILGFCHFEGATIGTGARVGPFARLRPGADLGADVHIGNFVEVKKTTLGTGAKANHLSYLGDGNVGAGANIGAGTIFCNYDGFNKEKTVIGEGAFIGSNSSLVAPVTIGKGAYIGSGSVITKDVNPGALALSRSAQDERPGWADKFRIMMSRRKAAQKK